MENQEELIPIEKIREMVKEPSTTSSMASVDDKLDNEFKDFLQNGVSNEEVKKHNKKRFKLLKKRKEMQDNDISATSVYQSRYDRETWFYKRHKDTIDKYIKKDEKSEKKNANNQTTIIVDNPDKEDVARIGYYKMLFIVWFDLIFCTVIGNIVASPIHLVRYIAELFYKMKKAIAITVAIITVVIILTVGLIFGISSLMNMVQGLS